MLAACGGNSDDRSDTLSATTTTSKAPSEAPPDEEATKTTTTSESPAALADALLTLDDMPTGWTTAPELLDDEDDGDDGDGDGDGDDECNFEPKLDDDDQADAAFKEGELGPFVLSSVGRFEDEDTAIAYLEEFQTFIDRCQSFEEDGVSNTVSPLSFPAFGDSSFAFRLTVDDPEGFTANANVIVIRKNELATYVVVLTALEAPDAALTEELATIATERL